MNDNIQIEFEGTDRETVDAVFEALDHPIRREVLRYLRDTRSVMLGKLTLVIAEIDAERRDAYVTEDEYERVRVQLHHTHLPKLAALGMLEYPEHLEWVKRADIPDLVFEALDHWEAPSEGLLESDPVP